MDALPGAAQRTYEAYGSADPPLTNLLTWAASTRVTLAFKTDACLERARATGLTEEIVERLRRELRDAGCSASAARTASVGFLSEEEVERGGGPMTFFR